MKTYRTDGISRVEKLILRVNRRSPANSAEATILDDRRDKLSALAQTAIDAKRSAKRTKRETLELATMRQEARLHAKAGCEPRRLAIACAASLANLRDSKGRSVSSAPSDWFEDHPTYIGNDAMIRNAWKKIQSAKITTYA